MKYNPITDKFKINFLLEAQSHSGLPFFNKISLDYFRLLSMIIISDDMLDKLMDEYINSYMITVHRLHKQNKKWKSYDW